MNNSQVAHVWANQSRESGEGSNFFFHEESIFSYGHHFEVARLMQTEKGKTISVHTSESYSNSTSQHQSYARQACHGLHEVFTMPTFPVNRGDFKATFAWYMAKAVAAMDKASRARVYGESLIAEAEGYIAEARRLKAHFPKLTKGLRVRSISFEEVERSKARAKREAAKRVVERERAIEKARVDAIRHEAEWLAGERAYLPNRFGHYLLRKHATKDRIETSHGAEVTTQQGKVFYKAITKHRATPEDCPRFEVGFFNLTRLTEQGAVIGCHVLSWETMDTCAKAQGWVNSVEYMPMPLDHVYPAR